MEIFSKEDNMSFFKKTSQPATTQKDSEAEKMYNSACLNMEIATGNFKNMSQADKIFIDMCKDILENGTSTEGEKVRPKWEDGSFAYTIKQFGVVNRYDLSKEFPLLTLRRTALKSATDEMLWIWQRKWVFGQRSWMDTADMQSMGKAIHI